MGKSVLGRQVDGHAALACANKAYTVGNAVRSNVWESLQLFAGGGVVACFHSASGRLGMSGSWFASITSHYPFALSGSRNDRIAGLEKRHSTVLPLGESFDTAFGLLRTNGPRGLLETSRAS